MLNNTESHLASFSSYNGSAMDSESMCQRIRVTLVPTNFILGGIERCSSNASLISCIVPLATWMATTSVHLDIKRLEIMDCMDCMDCMDGVSDDSLICGGTLRGEDLVDCIGIDIDCVGVAIC